MAGIYMRGEIVYNLYKYTSAYGGQDEESKE